MKRAELAVSPAPSPVACLRFCCAVTDPGIVDQALEETVGRQILIGTDIKTTIDDCGTQRPCGSEHREEFLDVTHRRDSIYFCAMDGNILEDSIQWSKE